MGKRATVLDWQMLEGNAEWPPPTVLTTTHAPNPRRLPQRWRWWALSALLVVLLPALALGYREVRRADAAMTRVENEVRATVAADDWLLQHRTQDAGTNTTPRTSPRLESSREPHMEARHVEVRDDYAMVEMWVTKSDIPWLPPPYRETRFYQETEQGWLAAKPPAIFWQPLATLQAGRFTFVYGPRDAAAVHEASLRVEELDAELRAELGLSPTRGALTIRLLQRDLPSMDPVTLVRTSLGATLYAPSPALLPLPAHLSEGDALLQMVAGLLVKRAMDEALAGSANPCAWQHLATGLQRWLLWQRSELPSQIRYNAANSRHHWLRSDSLPHLAWLGPFASVCTSHDYFLATHSSSYISSYIANAATAFMDYVVFAYGRDHLPILLDGMHRYDTWDKLIPAVYGVSAVEFEQGWQDYLVAPYGVGTTP